jgi:hypothetical protein
MATAGDYLFLANPEEQSGVFVMRPRPPRLFLPLNSR